MPPPVVVEPELEPIEVPLLLPPAKVVNVVPLRPPVGMVVSVGGDSGPLTDTSHWGRP